jgi:predicted hotdog family 3-hydroxylacyl-ACP dehydratase
MCLLDQVTAWDGQGIQCRTRSHRAPDNPLRSGNRLAAIHAIEYGAQAMAVHGGLLARADGEALRGGYLAVLRDVKLHLARLDTLDADLEVAAERLAGDSGSLMYNFRLTAAGRPVAEGRATVVAIGDPS